jgi:hypothetical protein
MTMLFAARMSPQLARQRDVGLFARRREKET